MIVKNKITTYLCIVVLFCKVFTLCDKYQTAIFDCHPVLLQYRYEF